MHEAIKVSKLSKEYIVNAARNNDTLRDAIAHNAKSFIKNPLSLLKPSGSKKELYTALNSLSLSIEPGEVLGIVGQNGCGKSTFLKLLARITAPSEGEIKLKGRLAPLLEVGTGFNHELTGRENIFVNGTLLGMRHHEISERFDEIVEFAGVEQYLDTPVKRYSSGMTVRLGFAVAAHVQPEILLVDEVLAVGDAAFQRRCLAKMNDNSKQGRTTLFVTHNLEAIQTLCTRAIWLDKGVLRMDGEPRDVINAYLADSIPLLDQEAKWSPVEARSGSGAIELKAVRILDDKGLPTSRVAMGDDIAIEIDFEAQDKKLKNGDFQIYVRNAEGAKNIAFMTRLTDGTLEDIPASGTIKCTIPRMPLGVGVYSLHLLANIGSERADEVENAISFEMVGGDYFRTQSILPSDMQFAIAHNWELAS